MCVCMHVYMYVYLSVCVHPCDAVMGTGLAATEGGLSMLYYV